ERPLGGAARFFEITDERLHRGNQRAGDKQEVVIKNPNEVKQSVKARHDCPGLDCGDVRLWQPDTFRQFALSPAAVKPRRRYLSTEIFGKTAEPQRFDMFSHIMLLIYIPSHIDQSRL